MFINLKQLKLIILVCVSSLMISACEQAEDVTLHEPGVYQGTKDDLSTDVAALQQRMKNQMDR